MGSQPWKRSLIDFLSPDHEGEQITVERDGQTYAGMFTGTGAIGRRPHVQVNVAPPECPPPSAKHDGVDTHAAWEAHGRDWFSYEEWIPLERGVTITLADGRRIEAGPGWRRAP